MFFLKFKSLKIRDYLIIEMAKIDLHMHSKESDGKYTPSQLVDLAIKKKIPVIAITDHDIASGNKEAQDYAKNKPIIYVPGIEITSTPPEGVKELHIVGLFIDSENKEIKAIHNRHKKYAEEVINKIIEKLNNLGYKITFKEALEEAKEKNLSRPIIAELLIKKYPSEFKDRKEVFNKLLGKQGKAFVKSKGTSMKRAIEIIHNSGGLAFIAHPWFIETNMEKIIEKFVKLHGDGIEVSCTAKEMAGMEEKLRKIAKEKNLLISGGTDFHEFEENEREIGDYGISLEEFEKIKGFTSKSYLK